MRLPRTVNRRIGRAMHDYGMLDTGDQVLLAISGGMDSLVLARVLQIWQKKAPIHYKLRAAHVAMDAARAERLANILARLDLPLDILPARWQAPAQIPDSSASEDFCFHCARSRRNQLFAHAKEHGCNKIAFGHHQDDLIETFLLNLTCAGNISTMVPRQDLFSGQLSLIRPLAYLAKEEVSNLGHSMGLVPLIPDCPLAEKTRRQDMHQLAEYIYTQIPDARKHIFAALGNVRKHYLLRQNEASRSVEPRTPKSPKAR